MPDLLTHIIVAEGCRRGIKSGSLNMWFLVGTVLPDLLTRPFIIPFPGLYWFVMPLHTPVGLLVVCALLSKFFSRQRQAKIFYNLIGGAGLHLFLDFFQKHIGSGYHLFFPFSWASYEYGLFWPEASLQLLPLWLVIGAFLVIRHCLLRKAAKTFSP